MEPSIDEEKRGADRGGEDDEQQRHRHDHLDVLQPDCLHQEIAETALRADELIRIIRIPRLSARARWGVEKITQKVGEFAHAIGAVLHDPDRNLFRAVIGAIETAPIVIFDATTLFAGAFGANLADRLDDGVVALLLDEKGVSDPYIRQLAPVALKRAARKASA